MRIKLTHPMSLQEIALATNGHITSPYQNKIIHFLSTDSRETCKGDLFVALKGNRFDGENYITEIISKDAYHLSAGGMHNGIKTNDTSTALLLLAKHYKTKFNNLKATIGITGSVGKTTTKEFLKVILSKRYRVHATYKNMNNNVGVPLTVLSMPANTEVLVIEMGMNSPGEISRSSICISPNISIILNVGTSHIGNFGTREKIAKAKLEILDGMDNGTLIVPYGEPLLKSENALTFDKNNENADFYLSDTNGSCLITKDGCVCNFIFKFAIFSC